MVRELKLARKRNQGTFWKYLFVFPWLLSVWVKLNAEEKFWTTSKNVILLENVLAISHVSQYSKCLGGNTPIAKLDHALWPHFRFLLNQWKYSQDWCNAHACYETNLSYRVFPATPKVMHWSKVLRCKAMMWNHVRGQQEISVFFPHKETRGFELGKSGYTIKNNSILLFY